MEAPAAEAQRRPPLEDAADVGAHGVGALGPLARGVVLEDDVVGVERAERVEVLPVPGVVVGLDQLAASSLTAEIVRDAAGRPEAPFARTPGRESRPDAPRRSR